VARASALAARLVDEAGVSYPAVLDSDDQKREFVQSVKFKGPLPEKTQFRLQLPASVKDDAGRALSNQAKFPLLVKTGEQPPLVKFPARFGIIEARGERMLPVTVRNVEASLAGRMRTAGGVMRVAKGPEHDEEVLGWLRKLRSEYGSQFEQQEAEQLKHSIFKDAKAGTVEKITLPKPGGAQAFEVIGIPLPKPGFYVVELESPVLGKVLFDDKNGRAFVNSAALVTNMAAHVKLGAESSLVWVTSLDQGKPVAGAQVTIHGCDKAPLWTGTTDGNGVARIVRALARTKCSGEDYFITARSGDDFTFTLSSWQSGIESWRFNLPSSDSSDNRMLTTVFDRTLLRAGETVHMKHFKREHTSRGIVVGRPPAAVMAVVHEGSEDRFEMPLKWSTSGTAETDWKIPATAKQGTYNVQIGDTVAGSFRVEQFRVPTMRALLRGPKAAVIGESKVELDLQLNYLSGGGASYAPVKVRSVVQPPDR
jgi:alpha-2-macroglobulin